MRGEVTEIWQALNHGSTSVALIVGDGADGLAREAAEARRVPVCHVSSYLTIGEPDGWIDPDQKLRGHQVLMDLELLFSPEILIDPLRLLTRLARRHSLIAVWPGHISVGLATYSEQGRRDYYSAALPGEVLVVRSRSATFPDESRFELETVK